MKCSQEPTPSNPHYHASCLPHHQLHTLCVLNNQTLFYIIFQAKTFFLHQLKFFFFTRFIHFRGFGKMDLDMINLHLGLLLNMPLLVISYSKGYVFFSPLGTRSILVHTMADVTFLEQQSYFSPFPDPSKPPRAIIVLDDPTLPSQVLPNSLDI